ncbi:MAG: RNA polymerase sigma factor [Saprospiraceae bacterium]|nr:RNA polymerase sigma factor [Saprospiraceae bacterium]
MVQPKELQSKLAELHSDSYAWAIRCCAGDRHMAEEVLQDSYLKVLRKIKAFKGQASFKTWLFAIIRYTAIDHIKAKAKRKIVQVEHLTSSSFTTNHPTIETVSPEQLQPIFRKALDELSPQQRQILHLVFYQACSIKEAAEVMDIQLGTARTHYERGKSRLRQLLDKQELLKQKLL